MLPVLGSVYFSNMASSSAISSETTAKQVEEILQVEIDSEPEIANITGPTEAS